MSAKRKRDPESPEYDQLSSSLDGTDGGPGETTSARSRSPVPGGSGSTTQVVLVDSDHEDGDEDDIVQITPPVESSNTRGKRRRIATPSPEREQSYPPITSIQSQLPSSSLDGVTIREILLRRNHNQAAPFSAPAHLPSTPPNLTPSASFASLPPATQFDHLIDIPSPSSTDIITQPNTPSPTGFLGEPVDYLAVENTYGGRAGSAVTEAVVRERMEKNRHRVRNLGANAPQFYLETPLKRASLVASSSSSNPTKAITSSSSVPNASSANTPLTTATSSFSATGPIMPKQTPLSSYTCPICFSPPTNATATPCGHLACGSCLFAAVKSTLRRGATMGSDEPNVARCPVCRAVIEGWDGKGGGVIGIKVRTVLAI